MPKFKIGDEVKIVSAKFDWKKRYIGKTFVITENEGFYGGELSWSAPGSFGLLWKESELELVRPKGFEVGKVYKFNGNKSSTTYKVEAILSNGHAAAVTNNNESRILIEYSSYREVKPEDWRCLHYTNETPSLGGIPYKSESEVITIYKNSSGFVKAVRVDA